ncbi:MAG: transglycosylase family protein [Acidimicrobiales bacterium]
MLVTIVALGPSLAGAAPVRQLGGDDAQAQLAAARADYDDARVALQEAVEYRRSVGEQAAAFEVELRELDAASLDKVLAFEAKLSEARELAVNAYVRGGTQAEFETFLDAEAATDVVLRRHLMIGRVDQAEEAAQVLNRERVLVDREAAEVAAQVAAMTALYGEADAAVGRAERREAAAYEAVLAADAAAAAAIEAERRAEADRLAAEREAAAREAAAAAEAEAAEAVSDEPGSSGEAPSAPFVPPTTADDDQAEAWAKLVDCESGGNYQAIGGGGLYRGAYQFSIPTWESVGGTGDPAAASPAEQDYRARLLYERSGRGQWPVCGRWLR